LKAEGFVFEHLLRSVGVLLAQPDQGGIHKDDRCTARREKIHLLLSDVVMPQMGGESVFERLNAEIPDLKVLFVSGYGDVIIRHHGLLKRHTAFVQSKELMFLFEMTRKHRLPSDATLRYVSSIFWLIVLTWLYLFYFPPESIAATELRAMKQNAQTSAKLEVSTTAITFWVQHTNTAKEPKPNDANGPSIRVKAECSGPFYLEMIAEGNLVSDSRTIPIGNVSWQAFGDSSLSGLLSNSIPKRAGAWTAGGAKELVLQFFLKDPRNYREGKYEGTILLTIVSP
jgi:CheY-like chemotaxis protein